MRLRQSRSALAQVESAPGGTPEMPLQAAGNAAELQEMPHEAATQGLPGVLGAAAMLHGEPAPGGEAGWAAPVEELAPEGTFQPGSMGDGKGENTAVSRRTMKSWKTGDTEVGGKAGVGLVYGGVSASRAHTRYSGGSVETSTESYANGLNNVGGTKKKVEASEGPDGTRVRRKEDRNRTLKGTRTTTDESAYKDGDVSFAGGDSQTRTDKGTTSRRYTDEEEDKARAKDARSEAGVDKQMEKHWASRALEHVDFGAVGDESGLDLESFARERAHRFDTTGATSGVSTIEGGTKSEATARAGVDAEGSTLTEGRDTDAFGNERVSRAGASGQGFAGAEATASASHKRTRTGGAEVAAEAASKLGVGGEGAIGATTQTRLADKLTAEAGASAQGSGFLGAKGSGSASASHGKFDAKAGASGEAMAGIEASASGGAKAGINGAGFDLVGARAKGKVNGMAGAEVQGSGEASAHALTGAKASGSADAFAGAKADGQANVGASLGGVDGDGVVEGQAKAGAMAGAQGGVSVGPLGAGVQGGVEAFAGAKAGGEARFELGAGGLNFGAIGVVGEVSAGIGVRANGKASLALHDVGLTGRAGMTYGVGASVGGTLGIDPSFPVRLTLDKLAENKVIPSADITELISTAASLVYKPQAPSTAVDPPALTGAGLGPAPSDSEAEAPDKQTTFDSLMVDASPLQKEALQHTQASVTKQLESTGPAVLSEMQGIVSDGGGLFGDFMALLTNAFQASEDAKGAALEAGKELIDTGVREAEGVGASVGTFAETMMGEIHHLMFGSPAELADMDWEARLDDMVARVAEFAANAKLEIQAIIERVRKALAAIAESAIEAAVAPIRSLAGSLAGVVGYFTGKVSSAGSAMIEGLREGLEPAERGIRVPGMPGVLALPVQVTPMLDVAAGAVRDMGSFGRDAIAEGLNSALDTISGGLGEVLGVETGGLLGGLSQAASFLSSLTLDGAVGLASVLAEGAKPMIRAAVWLFEQMMAAAQAAASWFLGLFG